jgi:hypothetical protein
VRAPQGFAAISETSPASQRRATTPARRLSPEARVIVASVLWCVGFEREGLAGGSFDFIFAT